MIRSDQGSAFIANMMDAFRRIMGVKNWDFSSPHNPTHHGLIETRHRDLQTVLNVALNKGDLSEKTLEFYCSVSAQRHNQYIHDQSGYTPHHLTFGETPRHQHNFMMIPTRQEIADLAITPMDKQFIQLLKDSIRDNIVYVHYQNDERLHKEKAHRLTKEYTQRHTAFEHRVNDIVSYNGEIATVIELLQPTVTGPTKALIRLTTHEGSNDKKVLYSDLLPIGIQYPELMIDILECEIAKNKFCFFYEPAPNESTTLNIFAGLILATDEDTQTCKIHHHQQTTRPKNKFQPLWTQSDGKIFARGKQQKHQIPVQTTVAYKDIIVTTTLENDRVSESVLHSLRNQGAVTMHPIIRHQNVSPGALDDEPPDYWFNDPNLMDGNSTAPSSAMHTIPGASYEHQLWMTRLTNRADQLGVPTDTLVESLYRIPDTYFATILASYESDHRRSEMVQTAIRTMPHHVNRSILASPDYDHRRSDMILNDASDHAMACSLFSIQEALPLNNSIPESPVIGWAPHPSAHEITRGSGHTYDLPTTPESLRQWLRPMPTRSRPP